MVIRKYTDNSLLDELIEQSWGILFYGPAGAGKTTLLIHIAGNICSDDQCIYISTEETLHYERVAKNPERFRNVLFTEAYDMETLLKAVFATYLIQPKYVFVDSINSLFRVEALKEDTITKQALVISLLLETVNLKEGKVFASAQVRIRERRDLEIPGQNILEYYFDSILRIAVEEYGRRIIKPYKYIIEPKFSELVFKITSDGVSWEYEY
ncbi:MAG: AAA family ATPase [Desulfurococcaceae archaeon]